MGDLLSNLYKRFERWKGGDVRILILGIDAVGKTTLLYRLKLGETVQVIPTIGFNVETFRHDGVTFVAWETSGNWGMRPLWRHYYADTRGIVFVVDSSDRRRISEARDALHMVCDGVDPAAPLLVLANKQDLDGAMTVEEIKTALELDKLYRQRKPHITIQPTVIIDGKGIKEGFDWLASVL